MVVVDPTLRIFMQVSRSNFDNSIRKLQDEDYETTGGQNPSRHTGGCIVVNLEPKLGDGMGYTYKYALGLEGIWSGHLAKIGLIRNFSCIDCASACHDGA